MGRERPLRRGQGGPHPARPLRLGLRGSRWAARTRAGPAAWVKLLEAAAGAGAGGRRRGGERRQPASQPSLPPPPWAERPDGHGRGLRRWCGLRARPPGAPPLTLLLGPQPGCLPGPRPCPAEPAPGPRAAPRPGPGPPDAPAGLALPSRALPPGLAACPRRGRPGARHEVAALAPRAAPGHPGSVFPGQASGAQLLWACPPLIRPSWSPARRRGASAAVPASGKGSRPQGGMRKSFGAILALLHRWRWSPANLSFHWALLGADPERRELGQIGGLRVTPSGKGHPGWHPLPESHGTVSLLCPRRLGFMGPLTLPFHLLPCLDSLPAMK